jgi:hypothetical protein
MENPGGWGKAEEIIHSTYADWYTQKTSGLGGLSLPRSIADALREAGLLVEGD